MPLSPQELKRVWKKTNSLESTIQPSIIYFELKPNQYALIFKQHVDWYDTNNEYLAEAQDLI
jgi:hypothetical protein